MERPHRDLQSHQGYWDLDICDKCEIVLQCLSMCKFNRRLPTKSRPILISSPPLPVQCVLLCQAKISLNHYSVVMTNGKKSYIRHSLGSSRKSVHERHRYSDGLQVKWSVFWAIWLKSQDPQLSNDVYEGGVFIWSKSVKTRIFSKKLAKKQLFGRTQILIR